MIVLAGVVVIAFLLGGGIASFTQMNYGVQGNLITPIPQYNSHESQQLHTLTFATVTAPVPLPTSDSINSCNNTVAGSHECSVLFAYAVESTGAGGSGLKIKLYYDDESGMPLGSGNISLMKNPQGSTPDHILNPNVGNISRVDTNKFPYFPAIFLTDITSNAASTTGDAQNGGTPVPPDEVFGTWTSLENPLGDFSTGNLQNLGPGADPWPSRSNGPKCSDRFHGGYDTAWTAENIWHVANLKINGQPLISGHQYRVQFAMHDGDQTQGGDIGEGCVTITAP